MWVNEISIDKRFTSEYEYILQKLNTIKNLSYTKETTKERFICSLATTDENSKYVKQQLFDIVSNVILIYIKRRFIFSSDSANSFSRVALYASISHFDSLYEQQYLRAKMKDVYDYNIDGIVNFRLRKLYKNWQELRYLTADLLAYADEGDLSYITSLMSSQQKEKVSEVKIEKSGDKIMLTTKKPKKMLEILPIYNSKYYNILDAIIYCNPRSILVDNISLPQEMTAILKKILPIKYT